MARNLRTLNRSFAAGEISPQMFGRVDDSSFGHGAARMRNMISKPQGPAFRRPGFQLVGTVKDSTKNTRLLPFTFSTDQTMMIEAGDEYFRFHTDGATLHFATGHVAAVVDPAANTIVFAAPHGFASDAAVRVIVMGGAVIPTGLAETTTYFVIPVDAVTIKLSATSGPGAEEDITTTGSGTIRVFHAAGVPREFVEPRTASAIDNVANTISFAAPHGLLVADPIVFTTTGALPSPLVPNTRYFAIFIDPDTIAVANTAAEAIAGTAINILAAVPAECRVHYDYEVAQLVHWRGAGEGFFYCRIARPLENVPPAATTHWYALPEDGTYEIPTPYDHSHVFELQAPAQSNDVLSITHPSYPAQELRRLGATTWTLTPIDFGPLLPAPTGPAVTPFRGYGIKIIGVTAASPAVLQTVGTGHQLAENEPVDVENVGSIANGIYLVGNPIDGTHIKLKTVETHEDVASANTNIVASSTVRPTELSAERDNVYVVTAVAADGQESLASAEASATNCLLCDGAYNTISWNAVAGAARYRVYRRFSGLFAIIGELDAAEATSFKDDNIDPDLAFTPPLLDTDLDAVNPAAVVYFEQRRGFAKQSDVWLTRSGTESDLTYHLPVQDTDRIAFRIPARQSTAVRHFADLGGHLVLLTSEGEIRVTPLNSDALTPGSVSTRQESYIGSSVVQPVVLNASVLFAAARGGHLYEGGFLATGRFHPGDVSLRAEHLFEGEEIAQLAHCKAPQQIVWAISSSGKLLGFTYIPDQQIGAWHRHDTEGRFRSCAAVSEGAEDRLYVIAERDLNGSTVQTIERAAAQQFEAIEDAFFVDCGLAFDGTNADPALTVTLSGGGSWQAGQNVQITASRAIFRLGTADVGDEVRVWVTAVGTVYRLQITSVTSGTVAVGRLVEELPEALRDAPTAAWAFARDTISGFDHLNGKAVPVLADGQVSTAEAVAGGSIALEVPAVKVRIGIRYRSELQPLPIALQVDAAFGFDKTKNVSKATLRVVDSARFKVASTTDENAEAADADFTDAKEIPVGVLRSGQVAVKVPAGWSSGGQITVLQEEPLPLTVVSLALEVALGD